MQIAGPHSGELIQSIWRQGLGIRIEQGFQGGLVQVVPVPNLETHTKLGAMRGAEPTPALTLLVPQAGEAWWGTNNAYVEMNAVT